MKKINLLICLISLFIIVSCTTNKVYVDNGRVFVNKNKNLLSYGKENFDFQINKVNTDEIQAFYKYKFPDDLFGYPLYGDYEGILYLKINETQLLPQLNLIKLLRKDNGPNLKLLSLMNKGEFISVSYEIELSYTKAAGFGTINIVYQKKDTGYEIVEYKTDIKGYFYKEEDGMEIPSLNGDIIYKKEYPKESFLKLSNVF